MKSNQLQSVSPTLSDYSFEPLAMEDLGSVVEIENSVFPKPWSRALFENELKNPVSYSFKLMVDVDGAQTFAAYIIFWVVHGEAHILNIAVRPELKRMGLGRRLLTHTLSHMSERGVNEVFLEVRRSNREAVGLYEAFGFTTAYVREKYYGDEDAIVMKLII